MNIERLRAEMTQKVPHLVGEGLQDVHRRVDILQFISACPDEGMLNAIYSHMKVYVPSTQGRALAVSSSEQSASKRPRLTASERP